ncbi:MAG: FeoA family protein [Bacteroidota bacterium]|nr:FeoA family protein [Bacteroidota bacterium]
MSQIPLYHPVVVSRYSGDHSFIERFRELGLTHGTQLIVCRRAPLGGSIEVECRGARLGLRLQEAAMIYVRCAHTQNGNGKL